MPFPMKYISTLEHANTSTKPINQTKTTIESPNNQSKFREGDHKGQPKHLELIETNMSIVMSWSH